MSVVSTRPNQRYFASHQSSPVVSTFMERSATDIPHPEQSPAASQFQSPVPDAVSYSSASTPTSSDYPRSAQSTPSYAPEFAMSGRNYPEPQRYPPNSSSAAAGQPVPAPYHHPQHQMPTGSYPHEMAHAGYAQQQAPVWRDWQSYQQGSHYGHPSSSQVSGPGIPVSAMPTRAMEKVYSFVPIPGAQQHKRPRRRYEEIERMYKCGWNGCEKAYGTLNHLNAHVTMQSHGTKRTPEEFKEIRKEWKAKKKEEEAAKKAAMERERERMAAEANNVAIDQQHQQQGAQQLQQRPVQQAGYPGIPRQLPPISYAQTSASSAPYPAPAGLEQISQFPQSMYGGYPQGYGQHQQMYAAPSANATAVAPVPTTRLPQAQNSTEEGDADAEADNDTNNYAA